MDDANYTHKPCFKTRDIGLASFLHMVGHDYLIDMDDDGSVWFGFPTVTRKAKESYFSGAKVSARNYYTTLVRMKAEVFWRTNDN